MTPETSVTQDKITARHIAKTRRKTLATQSPDAALAACQHGEAFLQTLSPRRVAGYLAIGSELDPAPLLQTLVEKGIGLALPRVAESAKPLIFHDFHPGDPLIAEDYGTRAPKPTAPECVPNVILVPMLAFTRSGYRLGYGGGFYDRTIAAYREHHPESRFVGFAYAGQECDTLPRDTFDLPLTEIITETGVMPLFRDDGAK